MGSVARVSPGGRGTAEAELGYKLGYKTSGGQQKQRPN